MTMTGHGGELALAALTPFGVQLRNYAGEGPADEPEMMSFVSSRTCVMLDVTDSCRPRVGVPCLKCDSVDPGTIVCRG